MERCEEKQACGYEAQMWGKLEGILLVLFSGRQWKGMVGKGGWVEGGGVCGFRFVVKLRVFE